jgi:uncharacterized RDD family membrane protein YckC
MNHAPPRAPHAGLARRALALVYEALLLAAVLLAGALPFVMLAPAPDSALTRFALQCYLLVLCGVYYIWQWLRGGQTLPMKTWRIRLVTREGAALTLGHGARRYLYALAGTALFGAGFLWAFVDRDRQFLHDRLAGTRLVKDEDGRMKAEE